MPSFFLDIPSIIPFRLANCIPLSDKSALYLLSLQLALSDLPHSLLSMSIALLTGLVWRIKLLKLDRVRVPNCCINVCDTLHVLCGGESNDDSNNNSDSSSSSSRFMQGPGYRLGGYEQVLEDDVTAHIHAVTRTHTQYMHMFVT